ncbi:MAG TPA: family 1 glycosylhydrolase [Candidatus Borkfalkia avistercoris]|uniref:Family 1 glycosylhydrolase n=1 Tax=Candidatus Borkfalkia avistercoris TaxID=2838504 RepID=A0A9D2CY91_9FIRM|nr:family 1 glycosylhydrolase [Candidatus Borkfalkia avistercoris]
MSFQKDFLWCVGGAAAQQDGGYSDGGKGLNIWDALSEGHIKNNDTCHIACDHFHKWKEDLRLLKELGVNSYRFSVSLARLFGIGNAQA